MDRLGTTDLHDFFAVSLNKAQTEMVHAMADIRAVSQADPLGDIVKLWAIAELGSTLADENDARRALSMAMHMDDATLAAALTRFLTAEKVHRLGLRTFPAIEYCNRTRITDFRFDVTRNIFPYCVRGWCRSPYHGVRVNARRRFSLRAYAVRNLVALIFSASFS